MASMPRTSFSALLLTSISVLALSACSGSSGTRQAKSDAPMPPITEMDAAMDAPAPQSLSSNDTLTPVMPVANPSGESVEARMARLEQSVGALRSDYDRIMPAFATLNTTNERIQTLLTQIEKETGIKAAPVAATTTVTTTETKSSGMSTMPAPGTVSKAAPVTITETTVTKVEETKNASAPPLTAFKTQPTVDEARAEAARQTGKAAAAVEPAAAPPTAKSSGAVAGSGENSVKAVRIGEHGSKTRLVFDLGSNAKPDVKYDVDAAEKLLLVEMPATDWAGAASGSPKSPLIESWTAQKGAAGGSTMAVQLKKNARVVSTEFLKAEGGNNARLVMDIAAGG